MTIGEDKDRDWNEKKRDIVYNLQRAKTYSEIGNALKVMNLREITELVQDFEHFETWTELTVHDRAILGEARWIQDAIKRGRPVDACD